MVEFLNQIMPNVMGKLPELWKCTGQTLSMMLYSGIISFVIGIVLGVVLTRRIPSTNRAQGRQWLQCCVF